MDAADEQRLLHILGAAQGDPGLLALVPLDLVFASEPEAERTRLRTALLAAAVPHWFDTAFLATLMDTTVEEAGTLMEKLGRLTNVEPFPARGEGACNVHEASRVALRQRLRNTEPDLWQTYAQRAYDHLKGGSETHERIEALYHLFASDMEAAAPACEALDRELRNHPATRSALCLALTELKGEAWLSGAALVEALLTPLWYRASRGEVSLLEDEAQTLLGLAQAHARPDRVSEAYVLLGDVHRAHGGLARAKECFEEGLRLLREAMQGNPDHEEWQRDLSVVLNELGDVAKAQGDLAGALHFFTESKAIRERLVASDPANSGWQRDLSVSLSKLGDVAEAQGDLAGALRCFTEGKTIRERLAASDPANADWQRALSVSLSKLGTVAQEQGDLAGALRCFAEGKAILAGLAASDPTNAGCQRDLSASLGRLGDLSQEQGDLAEALRFFTEANTIRGRLAASDPANAGWQRDLSVLLSKLGNVAQEQGDLAEALRFFTEAKTIRERLAESDPANAGWQRDLSVSLSRLGDVAQARKDLEGAWGYLKQGLQIAERLAASDPSNAGWQRGLSVSCWNLAGLAVKRGKAAEARRQNQRAYEVLKGMKERGMHLSPEDLKMLSVLEARQNR